MRVNDRIWKNKKKEMTNHASDLLIDCRAVDHYNKQMTESKLSRSMWVKRPVRIEHSSAEYTNHWEYRQLGSNARDQYGKNNHRWQSCDHRDHLANPIAQQLKKK